MDTQFGKRPFRESRDLLLQKVSRISQEKIPLSAAYGRVVAGDITAGMMIPHYDRSPYDGYALRSADTREASPEHPVTLAIIGEIRPGEPAGRALRDGEAVKLLTGSPLPEGADAVVKYEDTVFTRETVILSFPLSAGQNIIRAGEDVQQGTLLARDGVIADTAVMGLLSSQGLTEIPVYRKLRVAVISTGNELAEAGETLTGSKIYNSNRYTLTAELLKNGFLPAYLGRADDDTDGIATLLSKALREHDAVLLTGGVSAGDYDLVPDAFRKIGAEIVIHGVKMKPGMAGVYGFYQGKPCIALSGNPVSALTAFYCIAAPVLRKYAGMSRYNPELIRVKITRDFPKGGKGERILRGAMSIEDGMVCLTPSREQGNVVISSLSGAGILAIVPGDHGPVKAGDMLDGFII